MIRYRYWLLFASLIVLAACGGSGPKTPNLLSISLSPAAPSLAAGKTQQLTATGSFSDGTTQDLTAKVAWSSSNTSVVTVTSNGLVTSLKTGTATITAASGAVNGTTTVIVTTAILASIGVTPADPTITAGGTQQFTATGSFSDNTIQDLTGTVTWSSSNTAVATISSTGLVTTLSQGTTTIKAVSGSVSGTTTLTLLTASLASIAVTPANPSIPASTTQQFTATGTFSDNTTHDVTSTVTWSSSNTSFATINASGLASAVAQGTTTIKAQSGTISGSTTLAVSASPNDVLTYHNDNARTGQNLRETILTPINVNATTFGKLFVISVDGKVDAQPLYVSSVNIPGNGTHNVLVVATEHDSVYAFDADSGAQLWQVSMLKSGETTSEARFGCGQVSPEIGVTATPVVDRAAGPNGTIYVVAMSKSSSGTSTTYFQRLHALNLTTGAEEFSGPQDVHATFPGTGDNSSNGSVVFDPGAYKERPGLLLLNGIVYTAWSSHCDIRPYTGWIMGYDQKTLAQVNVFNIVPNGNEASFWNSGAGFAADSAGNMYQLAANGEFDTTLNANGFPAQGDFGNAFLKFSTIGNQLAVADYFALFNTVSESNSDTDLGSGGAMVLPDLTDASSNIRHLAVGAGKDGNIYVVDRDNMGKFNPNSNNIYQQLTGAIGSEFGMPAYFNNTVFYGGVGDSLKAFSIVNAKLGSSPSSQSANTFPFPGTTPGISANGTANGIVWATENSSPAVLHAYDATNLAKELYNSNQAASGRDQFGTGNKFITPTIVNGKVYVGTTNGVGVFGLLP